VQEEEEDEEKDTKQDQEVAGRGPPQHSLTP
jgi:hypothetical protein